MRIRKLGPRGDLTWKVWFAWFPVRINPQELLFLEYVERRCSMEYAWDSTPKFIYEYRKSKTK